SPPPEPDYLHRSLTISTGASSCRDSGQPVDSPRDPGIVSERLGRPHTRTNARFLLTTMVALVVALPGPAGARTVLPDGTGGDHPLTRSFVTGNGEYPFTSQGIAQSYGSALVVVFGSSALSLKTIEINDGVESMCCGVASLTRLFPGGPGGAAGRLIIFTTADNASESGEKIAVDGVVVGGPIDANLGPYASLFDIPVHYQERHNAAVIYTPADYFAWHLAVQVVGHP